MQTLRNNMPRKWWHDEVVYQIYVQSFKDSNGDGIGDINGIRECLPYIKNLGVGCIWLTPIMDSPFWDCGYDCSDFFHINPQFGTMADFENLVEEVHIIGLKIILDIIPGYVSVEHPWFQKAKKDRNADTREYFLWGKSPEGAPPNNWFSCAAAQDSWTYNPETDDYYYHAFLPEQPNLNWNSKKLYDEMFKVFKFWLDKGIDGYRIDAINYVIADKEMRDNPGEGMDQLQIFNRYHQNVHVMLKGLRKLADTYGRDIMLVGEVFPGTPIEAKDYYGNHDELHLNFNLSISQIIKKGRWYDGNYVKNDNNVNVNLFTVKEFREAVQENDVILKQFDLWPTVVLANHDQPRIFTSYARLGETKYKDKISRLIAGYLLFTKGTPFLYYGDEIGMQDMFFDDIHSFKDTFGVRFYEYLMKEQNLSHKEALEAAQNISRDSCRTPMQWNGDKNAGFSTSSNTWLKINKNYTVTNVENQEADKDSLLNFYRKLIAVRKEYPVVFDGDYQWIDNNSNDYMGFLRVKKNGDEKSIAIFINFSKELISLCLEKDILNYDNLIMTSYDTLDEHHRLRPFELLILEV